MLLDDTSECVMWTCRHSDNGLHGYALKGVFIIITIKRLFLSVILLGDFWRIFQVKANCTVLMYLRGNPQSPIVSHHKGPVIMNFSDFLLPAATRCWTSKRAGGDLDAKTVTVTAMISRVSQHKRSLLTWATFYTICHVFPPTSLHWMYMVIDNLWSLCRQRWFSMM